MKKKILKEFLKSGFIEGSTFFPTPERFLQGSSVSSPLVNLTLNGSQKYLDKDFLYTRYVYEFVVLEKKNRKRWFYLNSNLFENKET